MKKASRPAEIAEKLQESSIPRQAAGRTRELDLVGNQFISLRIRKQSIQKKQDNRVPPRRIC
jgi:hypothetical protein